MNQWWLSIATNTQTSLNKLWNHPTPSSCTCTILQTQTSNWYKLGHQFSFGFGRRTGKSSFTYSVLQHLTFAPTMNEAVPRLNIETECKTYVKEIVPRLILTDRPTEIFARHQQTFRCEPSSSRSPDTSWRELDVSRTLTMYDVHLVFRFARASLTTDLLGWCNSFLSTDLMARSGHTTADNWRQLHTSSQRLPRHSYQTSSQRLPLTHSFFLSYDFLLSFN